MSIKNQSIYSTGYLSFALAGVAGIYLFFFSFLDGSFSPYYGDEHFYLKNAESFAATGNLQASFTYSGFGSKIGSFDPHGPSYPILYGATSLIINSVPGSILLINWFFLVFGLFFLVRKTPKRDTAFLITLAVLGNPHTLFYGFSLMPELLHVGISIYLYLALSNFLAKENLKSLWFLIAIIFLGGLFRSTWFFSYVILGLLFWPKKRILALSLISMGIIFPMMFQRFFHEGVPNVFSEGWLQIQSGNFTGALDGIIFNAKRNIYFLLTYSEGIYYTVWKLWLLTTFISGIFYFKKSKAIQFGLILFLVQATFAIVLYKTYEWTEWRMLSPVALLLNLQILTAVKFRFLSSLTIGLSLMSLIGLFPFQKKLILLRKEYAPMGISPEILKEIEALNQPLIRIDSLILQDYKLEKLPVSNSYGDLIRYILPYYSLKESMPSHELILKENQVIIRPVKILNQ